MLTSHLSRFPLCQDNEPAWASSFETHNLLKRHEVLRSRRSNTAELSLTCHRRSREEEKKCKEEPNLFNTKVTSYVENSIPTKDNDLRGWDRLHAQRSPHCRVSIMTSNAAFSRSKRPGSKCLLLYGTYVYNTADEDQPTNRIYLPPGRENKKMKFTNGISKGRNPSNDGEWVLVVISCPRKNTSGIQVRWEKMRGTYRASEPPSYYRWGPRRNEGSRPPSPPHKPFMNPGGCSIPSCTSIRRFDSRFAKSSCSEVGLTTYLGD